MRQRIPAAFVSFLVFTAVAQAQVSSRPQTVVVQWNAAFLQGVRDSTLGPPMVARALAVAHTCMYDAWAAYDRRAAGTAFNPPLRPPVNERSIQNKEKAISFAAYRAAVDLFSWDKASVFDPLMQSLGYDPNDETLDITKASGIGNAACAAALNVRRNDGANQLGNLTSSGVPYADYTGYTPRNLPSTVPVQLSTILDPNHWQPLVYFNGTAITTQTFVGAQFSNVMPFALTSPDQFFAVISQFGSARYGSAEYLSQARELLDFSAQLTDERKMIAEYWANGPHSELPPGHWDLFAEYVSARDHHNVDDDVKMFFALTNAIFDAGISAWDAKRILDSVRPVTAIPFLFHGQLVNYWGGPGKGTVYADDANWIPYQPSTIPTPSFPEFISGHSTFSAAGATILTLWTGSMYFGNSVTFEPGSSAIEPGLTPKNPVTLRWRTFQDAANQAGISRRYGGIHFRSADLTGRYIGDVIAYQAWLKAKSYFDPDVR